MVMPLPTSGRSTRTFPSFAAAERERSALPLAREGKREWSYASPCISQTTRPWSIGNRITRWAPERGAREAAANGPRGLAPPQSPLTLPRVCCSPPHRTRAFGSPELSLRDQSHPRPLTASKKLLPSLLLRHEAALPTARGEEREWTCLSLHLSSSPCFFSRDPAG